MLTAPLSPAQPVPTSTTRRRISYVMGWRWGLVCGLCFGIAIGASLVAAALHLGAHP